VTTGWRYHADQDKWTFPAYGEELLVVRRDRFDSGLGTHVATFAGHAFRYEPETDDELKAEALGWLHEVAQNERGFWSEVEATVWEATREGRAQGENEP
jgi:hypothetical protein